MPTIPPETEPLPSTSVPCPSCGVPVAVGYPRCPKCKAAVPMGARARRGSVREQLLAGGTSAEPEVLSSGSSWLPWVLIALVIVAIGGFLAFRGAGSKAAPDDTSAKVIDDDADDDEPAEDDDPGEVDDDDRPPRAGSASGPTKAGDPMKEAAAALDEALRGERLWAKVTHDASTTLFVESSLCAQIEPQLADLAAPARTWGARKVECRAAHGQLMFEQDL